MDNINTVTITTQEYEELMYCKRATEYLLKSCRCILHTPSSEVFLYSVEDTVLHTLFPTECKKIEAKAVENYKKVEQEDAENV